MPNRDYPTLTCPPIDEALVDIRISTAAPVDLDALRAVADRAGAGYGIHQKVHEVSIQIAAGESAPTFEHAPRNNLQGFRVEDSSRKFVLQISRTGFTVSKIGDYTNWEELKEESRRLWDLYADAVRDFVIVRSAVRYVNRIAISDRFPRMEDVLVGSPALPVQVGGEFLEGFSRVANRMSETSILIVIQALETNVKTGERRVLLDLDAYEEYSGHEIFLDLWERLDRLRDMKNRAFFSLVKRPVWEAMV